MRVVIPTRGRTDRQITLSRMGLANQRGVLLVCPESEVETHKRNWPLIDVIAQPDPDMTIAAKRAWILEEAIDDEKALMLDDDMDFFYRALRESDGKMRLRTANGKPEIVAKWFGELAKRLTPETPHGGFGPRMHNDKQEAGWHKGVRMMFALGYHRPTVVEHCELGRIETREDMDVCLQLLRKGFPNIVTHEFAVGPAAYNQKGGCSEQRTTESSDADAYKLAELHEGYVRVVHKNYKNHARKEVVCNWKKALADGELGRKSE